jgi:hypothetical protein
MGNPWQRFDIGPAGLEWRFATARAPEIEWCRAAYDFAGLPCFVTNQGASRGHRGRQQCDQGGETYIS